MFGLSDKTYEKLVCRLREDIRLKKLRLEVIIERMQFLQDNVCNKLPNLTLDKMIYFNAKILLSSPASLMVNC